MTANTNDPGIAGPVEVDARITHSARSPRSGKGSRPSDGALTDRPLGAPVDRLFAAYAIMGGAALLFPHRPENWLFFALGHVAAAIAGFGRQPFKWVWDQLTRLLPRAVPVVGDLYPIVIVPFLYSELPVLNLSVWNGHYFDDAIIRLEQFVFGGQPSLEWAVALPSLPLSEFLHTAYLSYYFIIVAPSLIVWWKAGRDAARYAVFSLMLAFVAHYIFFIWFPVQGPRYLFPAPGGPIAEGHVYALTHYLLEAGSSRGAAFPSSHVGVAAAQTVIAFRYYRPLGFVLAPLGLALACGAIYGGFHYATDAVVGAVLGGVMAGAGPTVYRWIEARS